jgi:hypothetical protein
VWAAPLQVPRRRAARGESGRTRVELTADEAVRSIHWAAQLTGWDDHEQHPLFIYPPLEAGQG